jgi:hypothetical protein
VADTARWLVARTGTVELHHGATRGGRTANRDVRDSGWEMAHEAVAKICRFPSTRYPFRGLRERRWGFGTLPSFKTKDHSLRVWRAATSKADPRRKQDWFLKRLQGGLAHPLAACVGWRRSAALHRRWRPKRDELRFATSRVAVGGRALLGSSTGLETTKYKKNKKLNIFNIDYIYIHPCYQSRIHLARWSRVRRQLRH